MIPHRQDRRYAPGAMTNVAAGLAGKAMRVSVRAALAARAMAGVAGPAVIAAGLACAAPVAAQAAPVWLASVDARLDAYPMAGPAPEPLADAAPDPAPAPDPAGSTGWPGAGGGAGGGVAAGAGHGFGGRWAVFGQMTFTGMYDFPFKSPYMGGQSLPPKDLRETFDATLYLGVRPWAGGEIWANGEVDQGFGIGNTFGLAGYASGEAYKLGKAAPYTRLQRLFVRQTFGFGGGHSDVSAQANQLAGAVDNDRLVVTAGKLCVVDVFDTNKYAHDPRGDFLNWSIIDAGAFDYAGDPWGYSYGGAAELYWGDWTARAGLFNLSTVPAGMVSGTDFGETQLVLEGEHRHVLGGHPGAVRLAVWRNHGRLARYSEAVAWGVANGSAPDGGQVLRMQDRWGGYLNAEQELTGNLGAFVRASTADGAVMDYDFTDIDTSVSGGVSLAGKAWGRGQDTLSFAVVANRISKAAQAYFAAGGGGILIGDGQLPHPGTEGIVELSYTWRPITAVAVTADDQVVVNPAYNRDRGPVEIVGLRIHAGF